MDAGLAIHFCNLQSPSQRGTNAPDTATAIALFSNRNKETTDSRASPENKLQPSPNSNDVTTTD